MPFVRIGEMGDPSENWEHTIKVCKTISVAEKPIVIVTKHWRTIPLILLKDFEKLNLCINTSISALDSNHEIEHRLDQFYNLKSYCSSILRIVSCDFNKENKEGRLRAKIQEELFEHTKNIDTIFRPSPNNPLVLNKIINVEKIKFLKSYITASVFNKETYFGDCEHCPEMCGLKFSPKSYLKKQQLL